MNTQKRLIQLEERVRALEAGGPSDRAAPDRAGKPGRGAGTVGYTGDVRLDGHVRWRIEYAADAVLTLPGPASVDVLAALGHPLRLAIVRRLLTGPATAVDLQHELAVNTTGKLYHHLRALVAAHVVSTADQTYSVPATAVVPVLTLLLAAGDVAGQLPVPS